MRIRRLPALLGGSILLLSPMVGLGAPAYGQADGPACQSLGGPESPLLPATITGSGRIVGTRGDDVIFGSPGPDVLSGLGGDDLICGNGGNDYIDGGPGDDQISGDPFGFSDTGIIGHPASARGADKIFGGGVATRSTPVRTMTSSMPAQVTTPSSATSGATLSPAARGTT
ncbi:MAG: hypothetical protein M3011_12820 [Actinomycetota bacterium]|nr:hypothetical protein [Actinomycetota bacterium]